MLKYNYDLKYLDIVNPILENKEFNKLNNIEHHGITRLDHSIRVSYYSYKISKVLKLDYREVARAGLLHDFFLSDEERTLKERFISVFTHPRIAVRKAGSLFELSDKEKNIIESHMFPLYTALPKYAESWLVSCTDKVVGSYEFLMKFGYKVSYIMNIYLIFLFNVIK
ncbi:MAG: HD domain-containing protein [Bacilli bacterium]|nr:HD domain-containing protein [Bacilli bacterium]